MQSFSSAYELQIFQCLKYKVYVRRLQYRQGEESVFMWITSWVSLLHQYRDGDDVPDDVIMRWTWSCLWWFLTLTLPSPVWEAVLKYATPSSEEKLECELSTCIISDYSNKSVDLFWFPLWSTRCFGSPTSTKYFNSILRTCDQYVWNVQWRQWKGTPCYCYISSIFILSPHFQLTLNHFFYMNERAESRLSDICISPSFEGNTYLRLVENSTHPIWPSHVTHPMWQSHVTNPMWPIIFNHPMWLSHVDT